MNLANKLTCLRVALIPVILGLYCLPARWAHLLSMGCFAVAGITDWWDGYLARTRNMNSALGSFLDPVADKLLVCLCLVFILFQHTGEYAILIPVALMVGREIVVSALREWMAEAGQRQSVQVRWCGKLKTAFQMLAIGFLLTSTQLAQWLTTIGIALLWISTVMTLYSMMFYFKCAWSDLTS